MHKKIYNSNLHKKRYNNKYAKKYNSSCYKKRYNGKYTKKNIMIV